MKFKTHENKLHWNKIKHNYGVNFKDKYIYVVEKSYFNLDLNKFEFLNYNLFFKYIFN